MNNIKTEFSIKDLENFSGIKAHTIRIWEKRYGLLKPNRTDSNIRYYDISNLQKLLNVSFLYTNGFKISKIAELSETKLPLKVKEFISTTGFKDHAFNSLKLAMLNYDESLFNKTYNNLLSSQSFRTVFKNVFIPFLNEIGLLWQVNSITPAQEHFISNLIVQKIHINIERIQMSTPTHLEKTFVLYLPLHEIHEIGLLFLHYELLLHGYRSIYLGTNVPIENLTDFNTDKNKTICFISYLTVEPSLESLDDYFNSVQELVLKNTNNSLWILGSKINDFTPAKALPKSIQIFKNVSDLLNKL